MEVGGLVVVWATVVDVTASDVVVSGTEVVDGASACYTFII